MLWIRFFQAVASHGQSILDLPGSKNPVLDRLWHPPIGLNKFHAIQGYTFQSQHQKTSKNSHTHLPSCSHHIFGDQHKPRTDSDVPFPKTHHVPIHANGTFLPPKKKHTVPLERLNVELHRLFCQSPVPPRSPNKNPFEPSSLTAGWWGKYGKMVRSRFDFRDIMVI